MTVTLQFANEVRRLGREGMNVGEIAATLGLPEADIMETLTMLGLPLPGESVEQRATVTDQERAAMRDRMPKKMQDRMDRIAKRENDCWKSLRAARGIAR